MWEGKDLSSTRKRRLTYLVLTLANSLPSLSLYSSSSSFYSLSSVSSLNNNENKGTK